MKPISFSKNEIILDRTEKAGIDYQLPVVAAQFESGEPIIISCWQLSFRDILRLVFNRRIFICFLIENNIPPVGVATKLSDLGINEET